MNEDEEVLTQYEVSVKQQEFINQLFDIVYEHDRKIKYIRYCCIWMTIIITVLVLFTVILAISIK